MQSAQDRMCLPQIMSLGMSSVSIRSADLSDISDITRIYAPAVEYGTASFELDSPHEAEMARRMRDILSNGFPYIVAELDGVLAGYAYAGPFRARLAFRPTIENSVYVATNMQRRGVGRALLAALIEAAATLGFRQMIAVIGDSAKQAASIGLLEAAGFRHVGDLENIGFKHGRWLDSVLMQRSLGQGSAMPPD
jgi:L-amino acid N-acyltransferase YncA